MSSNRDTNTVRRGMLVPIWQAVVFAALTLGICGDCLALFRQNRSLERAQVESLGIRVGSEVVPISGRDLNGNPASIPYANRKKVLLLVFSPTCGICMENWANWKAILQAADPNKVDTYFVNISKSNAKRFFQSHDPGSTPVIAGLSSDLLLSYKFRSTPQTVLVSGNRLVEGVWTGLLTTETTREVIGATIK